MTFVLKISVDLRQSSGDYKPELSDEVFVISGVIKALVSVISLSLRLTDTFIISIMSQKPNPIIVLFHIVLKKLTKSALC